MNLFRLAFVLFAVSVLTGAHAQKQDRAIKAVINQFFEGMEKGDTTLMLGACTETPVLQTVGQDKAGQLQVHTEDFREFVRFIGSNTHNQLDERIKFGAIHAEAVLASVWTPYTFYLNGKLSHCGTNSFQLVKTGSGWKIQYIIDTRRKDCK